MQVRIETRDAQALNVLLRSARADDAFELAPGVQARCQPVMMQRSVGAAVMLTFVVSVGGGIATNLVSNAIWDWLKGLRSPPTSITIDRQVVEFDEGEIKRVVTERVTQRSSHT